MLALALDPQVALNGLVYVIRAALDGAAPVFQLVRYREVGGILGDAATLLDNVSASSARPLDSLALARDRPAAALRFGPDGRLYAAFEERGDASPAQGSYNGKILRLNRTATARSARRQPGVRGGRAAAARPRLGCRRRALDRRR
jgi:hypothetical protein